MIRVLDAGFYSTVQDLGRFNYRHFGVPISGAMDAYSAQLANLVLGNSANDAVVEMTLKGNSFQFNTETQICFAGANMPATLNGIAIGHNKVYVVMPNDILKFGFVTYGVRLYLAVAGGFQTEMVMNSRSFYPNITAKMKLEKGDTLFCIPGINRKISNSHIKTDTSHFNSEMLDVFPGPELEVLSKQQQQKLIEGVFSVSKNNNRMAYQFTELLKNNLSPIVTSVVQPGTIQLTPSGQLIALMRDSQTTGGYPRVLQLSKQAINRLAQKYNGAKIKFQLVNLV